MKILIALSVLFSHAAFSQTFDYSKKLGIGGSYGYNMPIFGNSFNDAAKGDQTYGGHLRYHMAKACGLEAGYTQHEFKDINQDLKVMDLLYFHRFMATSRFTPIAGIGLGVVDITNYSPSNMKSGVKLRLGAEYALHKNISAGLNVDYQHVNKMIADNNLPGGAIHALAARVGLTWYPWGADTNEPMARQEERREEAPLVAAPVDGDNDNDGVLNSQDKCPSTAAGVPVNAYGCAQEEKATIHLDVLFATGKAAVDSQYDHDLEELAAFMEKHKDTKIEIQGHTDNTGSKSANKKLSQARANAVKDYLVKSLNADGSRIKAKGYGDEMPVADNKTAEGKEQNRRVVALISE